METSSVPPFQHDRVDARTPVRRQLRQRDSSPTRRMADEGDEVVDLTKSFRNDAQRAQALQTEDAPCEALSASAAATLALVRNDGNALQFASAQCRNSRSIVEVAVLNDGAAF